MVRHKTTFAIGEPVWGMLEGYPSWWPARVIPLEDVIRRSSEHEPASPNPGEALVEWFNNKCRYSVLSTKNLRPFADPRYDAINKYKKKCDCDDLRDDGIREAREYAVAAGWMHDSANAAKAIVARKLCEEHRDAKPQGNQVQQESGKSVKKKRKKISAESLRKSNRKRKNPVSQSDIHSKEDTGDSAKPLRIAKQEPILHHASHSRKDNGIPVVPTKQGRRSSDLGKLTKKRSKRTSSEEQDSEKESEASIQVNSSIMAKKEMSLHVCTGKNKAPPGLPATQRYPLDLVSRLRGMRKRFDNNSNQGHNKGAVQSNDSDEITPVADKPFSRRKMGPLAKPREGELFTFSGTTTGTVWGAEGIALNDQREARTLTKQDEATEGSALAGRKTGSKTGGRGVVDEKRRETTESAEITPFMRPESDEGKKAVPLLRLGGQAVTEAGPMGMCERRGTGVHTRQVVEGNGETTDSAISAYMSLSKEETVALLVKRDEEIILYRNNLSRNS